MKSIKSKFQQINQGTFLFIFPNNFIYNPQYQQIIAQDLNDQAYLIDNLHGKIYEMKFLLTTNSVFIADREQINCSNQSEDIILKAGVNRYVEFQECQVKFNHIIKLFSSVSVANIKSINSTQFQKTICSITQLAQFLSNYSLFYVQNVLQISVIEPDLALQVTISIIRHYATCSVEQQQDNQYLILQKDFNVYDVITMLLKLNLFDNAQAFFIIVKYLLCVENQIFSYYDYLLNLLGDCQLKQFVNFTQKRLLHKCDQKYILLHQKFSNNISNPQFIIQFNPLFLLTDLVFTFVREKYIFSLEQLQNFIQKLDLPTQFLLDVCCQMFQNNFMEQYGYLLSQQLYQINNEKIDLTVEFLFILVSAQQIHGLQQFKSQCCYTDFKKQLTMNSQFRYIDEEKLHLEHSEWIDAAFYLNDQHSTIMTKQQLERFVPQQFFTFFKEEPEILPNEKSFQNIKFFTIRQELRYLCKSAPKIVLE